jgi:hypothetical protein
MKTPEIYKVHVSVCKNRNKIEQLCRIAILEKEFAILGLEIASNERQFQKILKEHLFGNLVYILTFDKKEKEVDLRRLPKLKTDMKEGEVEMEFEEALEWLKKI